MATVREQLEMDVSYIARFEDGHHVCSAIQGDGDSFGLALGSGPCLEDTYCQRMVGGELPHAIPDTGTDPRVRDLPVTTRARIGAYVGVPLYLPDGALYGTLCCLSHQARPDLAQRDVAVLRILSEVLTDDLADDARLRRDRAEVEQVLADEAVEPALQPIVDLASGSCHSLEALARFDAGSPDALFAKARHAGLRTELELLCLRRALSVLPHLQPEQRLSVNVSPDVACFAAAEWRGTMPLDRLVLEITEHAEIVAYDELRDVLAPLRQHGLLIAVDDAGAAFASLRHILELRPNVIKIDRSLVAAVDEQAARRAVVTTFVRLARDIGATVIAEGVERYQELDTLSKLGVDAVQGFLLARPSLDVRDLFAWTAGLGRMPWMPDGVWRGGRAAGEAAAGGVERANGGGPNEPAVQATGTDRDTERRHPACGC